MTALPTPPPPNIFWRTLLSTPHDQEEIDFYHLYYPEFDQIRESSRSLNLDEVGRQLYAWDASQVIHINMLNKFGLPGPKYHLPTVQFRARNPGIIQQLFLAFLEQGSDEYYHLKDCNEHPSSCIAPCRIKFTPEIPEVSLLWGKVNLLQSHKMIQFELSFALAGRQLVIWKNLEPRFFYGFDDNEEHLPFMVAVVSGPPLRGRKWGIEIRDIADLTSAA